MSYSYDYYGTGGMEIGAGYYIFSVIIVAAVIVAWWRIFSKAGEKGWKILIPVYNMYVMYKLFWKAAIFAIMIVLSIVAVIGSSVTMYGAVMSVLQGGSSTFYIGLFLLVASMIVILILDIIFYNKVSKAFGHGAGFTVGLVLLPFIFLLILAFDSSKYIGKERGQTANEQSAGIYRYREPMDR